MGMQTAPGYAALNSDNVTPFQHPVELDRNIAKANFRQSGALRGGDWALTPTGTSQQLSIAVGAGFILGQESAQQGGYMAWSDAAELKTFGAPSGSPRIDTLLLRVYDPQYGTLPSGTTRVQWDIVAGTPGATPSPQPDSAFISTGGQWVPGAWMKWAEVKILPGDTVIPTGQIYLPGSVISGVGTTWSQRYARQSGGVILCTSVSRPASPAIGDQIYEIDTKRHNIWNGTAWFWPYARGRVGGARWAGTGNFGTGISTEATNAALTLASFQPEANRAYKLKCRVQVVPSAGGVNSAIRIRETNTSGAVRGETVYYLNSATYGYKVDVEGEWDSGSSPAAVVWCITGQALAGGTISITGSGANFPTYFDIIDEGPVGNQTLNAGP
jgi:hypothetical protein